MSHKQFVGHLEALNTNSTTTQMDHQLTILLILLVSKLNDTKTPKVNVKHQMILKENSTNVCMNVSVCTHHRDNTNKMKKKLWPPDILKRKSKDFTLNKQI